MYTIFILHFRQSIAYVQVYFKTAVDFEWVVLIWTRNCKGIPFVQRVAVFAV